MLPETDEDKKLASLLLLNPVSGLVESSMKRIEAIIEEPAIKPTSQNLKRKSVTQSLSAKDLGIVRTKKSCTVTKCSEETITDKIKVAENNGNDSVLSGSSKVISDNLESKSNQNDKNENALLGSLVGDYGSTSGSESDNCV